MRIGTVKLGEKPLPVLVLDGKNLEKVLEKALTYKVKLVEVRGDLIVEKGLNLKKVLDLVGDYGRYAILTLRPTWEGGTLSIKESERLKLFETFGNHPSVGAVDIELRAEEILKDVKELVKSAGKLLIISYHDFEKTPSNGEILSILERARDLGADIIKVAFYGNSYDEAAKVCCVLSSFPHPKVFMVMGEAGKLTRVVGFHFGSLLTYTFLGKPVAPGQIPLEKLLELIREFYS